MSASPLRPETAPAPTTPPVRDDGRKPRSLADRLRLGLILLALPAAAVCIPTYLVSHFFGQRPKAQEPHTELLQQSLQQSADHLLPGPPPLGPDALTVTVRADHLAARMQKIAGQAQEFGGSASEGLSTGTEKHLSIELPAGRGDAFRQAVKANAALGSAAPSSTANPADARKDFVDVVIRAAGDDD